MSLSISVHLRWQHYRLCLTFLHESTCDDIQARLLHCVCVCVRQRRCFIETTGRTYESSWAVPWGFLRPPCFDLQCTCVVNSGNSIIWVLFMDILPRKTSNTEVSMTYVTDKVSAMPACLRNFIGGYTCLKFELAAGLLSHHHSHNMYSSSQSVKTISISDCDEDVLSKWCFDLRISCLCEPIPTSRHAHCFCSPIFG